MGHFAKTGQMVVRALTSRPMISAFAKRRPLEEGVGLTNEYHQRLEQKLAADPDNYGFGLTLCYGLLTKK